MRITAAACCLSGLAVLAACSSAPSVPRSPLDRGTLTCLDGSRTCTKPGSVRWSLPVPGSYETELSDGSELDMRSEEAVDASFEDLPPGGVHSAAFTGGRVITCAAGVVEAIDPGSGRVRWRWSAARRRSNPNDHEPTWCQLTVVAPGEVAVDDFGDFPPDDIRILNVATGAVGRKITLSNPHAHPTDETPIPDVEALAASRHVVSMMEDSTIYGFDRSSGALRWRARLRPWRGYAIVGHVLYADNANSDAAKPAATAIQRLDLESGRALPDLPLDRRLRGSDGHVVAQSDAVVAAAQPMSTLLFQSGDIQNGDSKISTINPSTGHARWTHPGDLVRVNPDSKPSRLVLLDFPAETDFVPDTPGVGTDIWTLRTVDATTGEQVSTVKTARSVPYDHLGVYPEHNQQELWNYDDSLLIADADNKSDNRSDRLEGVDPATGQVRWRGPLSGDGTFVLGDAPRQHFIIAESCAPSGIRASASPYNEDATCTKTRLYAINT